VLLRYLASVFLPLFADTKLTDLGRNELNRSWLALISGFAFAYSVGVITVAVPLIPFVFGQNYQADTHYAALLGMAAFARCLHVVGVPVTMARGHTVYALYVNFGLACAIGFACAGALLGGSLYAFMLGLFLGELVVAVCVIAGLPRILGQPISFIVRTVGIPYVGLGLISVAALHWQGVVFYSFAACMSVLVLLDLIQRLAPLIGKDYVNSLRRPHAESH
jgi:O-antigen/teichoic acid export membrane protein